MNIIFDLGGVLIDWNPRYLYKKIFSDEKEMEAFLAYVCTREWNEQMDAGKPFAKALTELQHLHPRYTREIGLYWQRWGEMLGGTIEETVEILEALSPHYPLYALTNWSAETIHHATSRFNFFRHFKGMVVSGAEKVKKPDAKIFQLLLDRYNLEARECLFIDDVLENVQSAKALGLKTIHFKSPEDLRQQLPLLNITFHS